jgi:hypothetical protein
VTRPLFGISIAAADTPLARLHPKLCSYVLASKMASHETFRIPQPYRTRPADSINNQCSLITRQVSKNLGNRLAKNSRLNRCECVRGGDIR